MKILLINGSPKGERSNSLQIANAFVKGIEEETDIELETIHLREKRILQCMGCFSCWKNASHRCVLQDDMVSILPFIVHADIIIYCFPLYSFSLPAILKNMIDRTLPLYEPSMTDRKDGCGNGAHKCRYDLSKQRTVLISTCGFYTSKGNYESVKSMFDLLKGKGNYFSIFVGQGELFSVPPLKAITDRYLNIVCDAGTEFARGGVSEQTKESLSIPLFPKEEFERMADASWGDSSPIAS